MISEKEFPISNKWIVANFIFFGLASIVLFIYSCSIVLGVSSCSFNILDFIIVCAFSMLIFILPIFLLLERNNLHYEFADNMVILKKGILAKAERRIPYGRIQNIIINQNIIDRILKLGSLTIETASDSGGAKVVLEAAANKGTPFGCMIGFRSNLVVIPGLEYNKAIELKNAVLKLMKANPIDDSHSGL